MKKCVMIILAAIIAVMIPVTALADAGNFMPDIEDKEVELSIHFYIQHIGVEVPIPGAEMAVYKIADVSCQGGSAEYSLLQPYHSLRKMQGTRDVTFDGMTATQSAAFSLKVSKLVKQYDQTAVTGVDGICVFRGLSQGMYLVKEIGKQGDAAKYETISPYIISLPLGFKSTSGNYWKYDVLSEPKTLVTRLNDSDSDSDSDFDSDFDSDSDSDSDSYSDSDSDTGTDSDKNDNNSDSDKSTSSNPQSSSLPKSSNTPTPTGTTSKSSVFDIEKVKTGVVTHIIEFVIILILSSLVIVLTNGRKKGEDDDERTIL